MSRPASGVRSRPTSAVVKGQKHPRGDVVSYEDLLVAQYLEELRKSPPYTKPGAAPNNPSPYLQKLAHTHIVPTPNMVRDALRNGRARPQSAVVQFRPNSAKPKMDPKFIADPNMYEPATPRERRRRRPVSAPTYRRPLSATYGSGSRPSSAKSSVLGRRVKPLYKKQQHTIVATAFKNGSRDVFTRVAAPTIKMLLEMCTDRLGLPHAARRLFLDDATEVFTPQEIPRDADIYISMGENFKNAYKEVKQHTQQQRTLAWTMNGLVWSQEAQRRAPKTLLSKRFRKLIEPSKRRVLVFKNGAGTEGAEIVADPERFEDFLVACTSRLELGTYARVLYDWEGKEVHDLNKAPVLDTCLQTWTTPVLGPLWVSKGEGFSPKGVNDFLSGLINYTKAKLKEAKHYQTQLQNAQLEETRPKVEIVAILSMSEGEIEETLEIVAKDVEDFSNALNRLKLQISLLSGMVNEEEEEGVEYKMKHMDKYDMDHRLVGAKGIRLKVFENGTYEDDTTLYFNLALASRGIGHDQKKLLARLLDQCSSSHHLANPKTNTAIKPVAQKLFDKLGNEITNVYELEYDQEIWLSFGEPWKNPFSFCLTAQLDKIRAIDIQGQKQTAVREQLMSEDTIGMDKASAWDAVVGIPEHYSWMTIGLNSDPMERDHVMGMLEAGEIDVNATFLKSKENPDLMLFAEPAMDTKKKKGSKDIWPPEAQIWVISQEGNIHTKVMPRLVLAVTSYPVKGYLVHPTLGPTDSQVEGFLVGLQKKAPGATQQVFDFKADGTIVPRGHPELALTYLGSRFGDESSHMCNESEGVPKGYKNYIAVCQRLEGKDAKTQRWALKQEKMENLGQWKHTKADNLEWNKRALSWPVDENGEFNTSYDWPMEGYILPYAPSMKAPKRKQSQHGVPLRLMVLKNGIRDISKAMSVVGPDLNNMRKDIHGREHGRKSKGKGKKENDADSIDVDGWLGCEEDLTVLKLEFILFLERTTSLLNLPFAARRVFDETGKEHFSLRSFTRDQLIYVSCGEPWSDPSLSKAEQQRRYLLANLGADVAQIRQFVALRNPENLVLEVEHLGAGAKLFVNQSALTPEFEVTKPRDSQVNGTANFDDTRTAAQNQSKAKQTDKQLSAHEASHQRAEERLNNRKWPWERAGADNAGDDEVYENPYTMEDTNPVRRSSSRRPAGEMAQLQKFAFQDGYIMCSSDQQLVLSVDENDASGAEVILTKRKEDDVSQRWTLMENGLIVAKHNPARVLTVVMPSGMPTDDDGMPLTYVGCEVALQNRKTTQFGRANQRWYYDQGSGYIQAFHTDPVDKQITAANRANVCTHSVMLADAYDQPGYMVDMPAVKPGGKARKLIVCSSCARAMRGRYRLERLTDSIDFACAMGTAKQLGIKQIGSFQCLNGKVDLSTSEAEHTLAEWEAQLEKLREELSVRAIAKEISAARVPFTVKVLAYKNGDGRTKPGELVTGSSVSGILEQCTYKLSLTQAARRLYTADGLMVLDLDDLVEWVRENYVEQATVQLRASKRSGKRGAANAKEPQNSLIDKVDLEDESEEEEDDEEEGKEAEESKANGQETEPDDSEDFAIGYEVLPTRQDLDMAKGIMIIPNPSETIEQDGFIYLWNFYAMVTGKLIVQIVRPVGNQHYEVVDQADFDIEQKGEYSVDMMNIPNTKWTGVGMGVKQGDIIAFYCLDKLMINYDVEDTSDEIFYYSSLPQPPQVGSTVKMNPEKDRGVRKYSLNAFIRPAHKVKLAAKETTLDPRNAEKKNEEKLKEKDGKKKKKKGRQVDPPPIELILKYPIEVWVSSGENFIKPEKVERQLVHTKQQWEQKKTVAYELEKEKHVLRQMQGRRVHEMSPGQYKATMNPTYPVLIEGQWQEPTPDEQDKHDTVHQLQTHLSDVKTSQKARPKIYNVDTTQRLYVQPAMKRVLVFPNGESITRAVYVWGESMPQLLDNSTTRLNLRKMGRYFFTIEGKMITDMCEIERDQLLCVSFTKAFQRPREGQHNVEVKANWSRARRLHGPSATDITVQPQKNPAIDVDPFGPSHLVGNRRMVNGDK